ncbi:hypothetical protein AA980_04420 [Neobacillus vireti]|nr:hypothetical protein AA980_04420 [Neobacillus vireti]
MMTGKLLGDGCITMQKGRKPRFQFAHTTSDKEWCFYCYEELLNGLPLAPPYYKKVQDNRIQKGFTKCFQVQSRTDPLITWLETIWYCNRIKRIPFDFLDQNLTELALAWWYQDDGHLSKKENIPKKVILSTDNFTSIENRQLTDFLAKKFRLYFMLDSQNRIILYDQLQIFYFLRLVEPYMHTSMVRKLISPNQTHKARKRTTIYLPDNIQVMKPTAEINKKLQNLHTLHEIIMDRTSYIDFYKKRIAHRCIMKETRGYQIIIDEKYNTLLHSIRNRTGLTVSQIVAICFLLND